MPQVHGYLLPRSHVVADIEGTYPPAGMHGGAPQPGIKPVYQVDDQGVPFQLLQP